MKTSWIRIGFFLAAFAVTLAVPFLLKPAEESRPAGARTLVIVSPHNEAIRHEFEHAFRAWHLKTHGEVVLLDWRSIGGTSEIVRYLDGEFKAADRVGRDGIGLDLFFGGGQYDHAKQAEKGHTVPCGLRERHPDWLDAGIIPRQFSGELFYDKDDRWYGCCLTSFGLCYNEDVLADLGIAAPPRQWTDLADARYFRKIALADPSKSGSINKAFEMVIQQQMQTSDTPAAMAETPLDDRWRRAMTLLKTIGANARYFTDGAGKVPVDVAQGDAAAGMCIDFYGRFQSEFVADQESSARMRYLTPVAGSSVSVDPISLLRGAPHRELAERFIDFVMSEDGQKLWDYRVGEPGGPVRYALRRLPIRKDLYTAAHRAHMSDPDTLPYEQTGDFVYQPGLTASLFGLIRTLIRAMCIDTHEELAAAWRAIGAAGGPEACPDAWAALQALPPDAGYRQAKADTAKRLSDKLEEARISRDWVVFFQAQYRKARELADRQGQLSGSSRVQQ
ncbi:MAG: extracellular solute-binding protein [Lentisphaerae bacterium]|nr:extracellular solute-binding protein [Lentisphaerota bacterium]